MNKQNEVEQVEKDELKVFYENLLDISNSPLLDIIRGSRGMNKAINRFLIQVEQYGVDRFGIYLDWN